MGEAQRPSLLIANDNYTLNHSDKDLPPFGSSAAEALARALLGVNASHDLAILQIKIEEVFCGMECSIGVVSLVVLSDGFSFYN